MSLKEEKKTDSIYSNNNSNYFTTSSKKRYKHIKLPDEIINHKNSDIKKISILLLCVYYYQVCSLEETYRIYNHYNVSNKEVNKFLFNDDKASHKNKTSSQYIIIAKENIGIRGAFEGFYKVTGAVKATLLSNPLFNFIKDLIVSDIEKKYQYIDSYTLAIKQHSSIKHYVSIQYLYSKAVKENVEVKCKHDETSIDINCFVDYYYGNRRKVEWDLIMRYNNKQVGIEVECGTTSNSDMYKKIIKHHALSYEQNIYRDVIIACPNENALEETRAKINKAIDKYYKEDVEKFNCSFAVRYYYLNLSQLNNKSLRSFLNEAINKKLHQY